MARRRTVPLLAGAAAGVLAGIYAYRRLLRPWLQREARREGSTVRRVGLSAAGTYAAYLLYGLRHPTLLLSGATPEEAARPLPGDELLPRPLAEATRAITIHASPAAIWPWLVQLGYGRAGWYSWYPLDNGGVPSPDRIVPELQHLAVGDALPDGPEYREGYGIWRVVALEPERFLVVYSARHPFTGLEVDTSAPGAGPYIASSWAFVLQPLGEQTTRLLVRVRASYAPRLVGPLARLFFRPADTVMERTMLEGIKERAEASR